MIRTVFRSRHTTYVDHDHFDPSVFTSSFVFYVVFCGSLFVFLSFFVDTLMMEGTSQLFITIFGHTLMMAVMFLVWSHIYFVFYVEIEDGHHCWKSFNIARWYSDRIT